MRPKTHKVRQLDDMVQEITGYMKFQDKLELQEFLDDFFIITANKYSKLMSLIMKALILSQEINLGLAKLLRKEDCRIGFESLEFRDLIDVVGKLYGKNIKVSALNGCIAEYRRINIFESPVKKKSGARASSSTQEKEELHFFNLKGYSMMEFLVVNEMFCICYTQSYYSYFGM